MQEIHKFLHNIHIHKNTFHCEAELAALLFSKQLLLSHTPKPHYTEAKPWESLGSNIYIIHRKHWEFRREKKMKGILLSVLLGIFFYFR